MPKSSKDQDEEYSEEETARRRDTVLKRMLDTPPKPHDEITGKPKPRATSKKKPPVGGDFGRESE